MYEFADTMTQTPESYMAAIIPDTDTQPTLINLPSASNIAADLSPKTAAHARRIIRRQISRRIGFVFDSSDEEELRKYEAGFYSEKTEMTPTGSYTKLHGQEKVTNKEYSTIKFCHVTTVDNTKVEEDHVKIAMELEKTKTNEEYLDGFTHPFDIDSTTKDDSIIPARIEKLQQKQKRKQKLLDPDSLSITDTDEVPEIFSAAEKKKNKKTRATTKAKGDGNDEDTIQVKKATKRKEDTSAAEGNAGKKKRKLGKAWKLDEVDNPFLRDADGFFD